MSVERHVQAPPPRDRPRTPPRRRDIVALLVALAVCCLGVEMTMRVGFGRVSRIRSEIEREYAVATNMRGPRSALLIGNSLLKEGVDVSQLRGAVGPGLAVQRFAVESTTYFDWYYGLRHLFHRGARPEYVVCVLSTRQWLSAGVRGEYTAGLMIDGADVQHLAKAVGADNTGASSLAFATLSSYYANRAEVRTWLMGIAIPGLQSLTTRIAAPNPPLPADHEIGQQALPRLVAMRDLCARYGARLIIVIPPSNAAEDGSGAMVAAARQTGVEALVPLQFEATPPAYYSDGFHLNHLGRAAFTDALASALRRASQLYDDRVDANVHPCEGQQKEVSNDGNAHPG